MINPQQVEVMYIATGFTRKQIAARLRCSLGHINRLLKDKTRADNKNYRHINHAAAEHVLWALWYRKTESYTLVAFMFGVTRQAVWGALNP